MNRDDIIRMAKEAEAWSLVDHDGIVALERFAALVAAAEREANKDRIETLSLLYEMVKAQRDELMQQQEDAFRKKMSAKLNAEAKKNVRDMQ